MNARRVSGAAACGGGAVAAPPPVDDDNSRGEKKGPARAMRNVHAHLVLAGSHVGTLLVCASLGDGDGMAPPS
jgi:hypothetical protein